MVEFVKSDSDFWPRRLPAIGNLNGIYIVLPSRDLTGEACKCADLAQKSRQSRGRADAIS